MANSWFKDIFFSQNSSVDPFYEPNLSTNQTDLVGFSWVVCFFPGGGTPHMKGVGMLVVSLRGVNLGFWSHLGCSGQNAIIFSRESLV